MREIEDKKETIMDVKAALVGHNRLGKKRFAKSVGNYDILVHLQEFTDARNEILLLKKSKVL